MSDILLDTGAAVSIVARDLLPNNYTRGEPICLEGFGGAPAMYETSIMPVSWDGEDFELKMAVAPRQRLKRSAIIGRELLGRSFHVEVKRHQQTPSDKTNQTGGEQ